MKLLLDGKPRNIYFRKDNTAYYKNNGIENNITEYFKKTGELKKTYSNLLVENNKTISVQPLKNRKIILGGAIPKFSNIDITILAGEFENIDKIHFIKGLLQLVILCKIECDNNDGNITFLTETNKPNQENKNNFIILLEIIFGCYVSTTGIISTNNIIGFDKESKLSYIGYSDNNIEYFGKIKETLKKNDIDKLKLAIKELFINIKYEDLCKQIDIAQKQINVYNNITREELKKDYTFEKTLENLNNISDLITEIKVDKGIDFEKYFT